jgi:hypothetical protein
MCVQVLPNIAFINLAHNALAMGVPHFSGSQSIQTIDLSFNSLAGTCDDNFGMCVFIEMPAPCFAASHRYRSKLR